MAELEELVQQAESEGAPKMPSVPEEEPTGKPTGTSPPLFPFKSCSVVGDGGRSEAYFLATLQRRRPRRRSRSRLP